MSLAIRNLVLAVIATALLSPATYADSGDVVPESIEVFTTSKIEVDTATFEATVFKVDGLAVLSEELGRNLPAEPTSAKRVALERISEIDDDWRAKAKGATESLNRAHSYGIKKLPAVAFDGGQAVVYGVTNLADAVSLYQQDKQ